MLSSNMISYLIGGKIVDETKKDLEEDAKQGNKLSKLINSVNATTYKNVSAYS